MVERRGPRAASTAPTTAARREEREQQPAPARAAVYFHYVDVTEDHDEVWSTTGLWKSADGGRTFSAVPPARDNHGIWFNPDNPDTRSSATTAARTSRATAAARVVDSHQAPASSTWSRSTTRSVPALRPAAGQQHGRRAELPTVHGPRSPLQIGTDSRVRNRQVWPRPTARWCGARARARSPLRDGHGPGAALLVYPRTLRHNRRTSSSASRGRRGVPVAARSENGVQASHVLHR